MGSAKGESACVHYDDLGLTANGTEQVQREMRSQNRA